MKTIISVLILLVTINLQSQTKTKKEMNGGIRFFHGSIKELFREAKKQNKLVFIDVSTEWCGPCKKLVKEVFPQKKCGDYFNARFISYKLDAEKGEGIAFSKKYEIASYPTLLFLNKDEENLYTTSGFLTADELIELAGKYISGKTNYANSKLLKAKQKFETEKQSFAEIKEYYDFLMSEMSKGEDMKTMMAIGNFPCTLVSKYKNQVLTNDKYLNLLKQTLFFNVYIGKYTREENPAYWFIADNKDYLDSKNCKVNPPQSPVTVINTGRFLVLSDLILMNRKYVGDIKIIAPKREALAKKHIDAFFKTSEGLERIAMQQHSQAVVFYFLRENRTADILTLLQKMLDFHKARKEGYQGMNLFATAAIAGTKSKSQKVLKLVLEIYDHYEKIGDIDNIYHFRSMVYENYKMYDKALIERNRALAYVKEIEDDYRYKWYLKEKARLDKLMKNK